jgi:hypothetical protein
VALDAPAEEVQALVDVGDQGLLEWPARMAFAAPEAPQPQEVFE